MTVKKTIDKKVTQNYIDQAEIFESWFKQLTSFHVSEDNLLKRLVIPKLSQQCFGYCIEQ